MSYESPIKVFMECLEKLAKERNDKILSKKDVENTLRSEYHIYNNAHL